MKECTMTAKTVEEAIELACDRIGLPREEVEIEIIDLPKKGLFGIGAQPAKVRVYQESSDKAEIAVAYIKDILTEIGLPHVEVTAKVEENNNAVITLSGEGLGVIIGRRGETLDSLQYLTGLVANRADGDYRRVTIDSGNYREKREKTLETLAKKLANNAVKTGRSSTLEPMNPYERRIIHAAVSQVEGALSTSVGEEPNRRVVISSANPKKPRTDGRGKGKGGSRRGGRPSGESRGEGKSSRERRPYREREELKEPEAPRAPISEEERILRSAPPSEAADLPLFGKIEIDD